MDALPETHCTLVVPLLFLVMPKGLELLAAESTTGLQFIRRFAYTFIGLVLALVLLIVLLVVALSEPLRPSKVTPKGKTRMQNTKEKGKNYQERIKPVGANRGNLFILISYAFKFIFIFLVYFSPHFSFPKKGDESLFGE